MALALIDNTMSPTQAPVRPHPMYGLSELHAARLADALGRFPKIWSVESQEDYEGELTIFVVSERKDAPLLVLTRSARGCHLARNVGDDLVELGCFGRFADVLIAVSKEIVSIELRGGSPAAL